MREHMGYEAAFRQGSRENAAFCPQWVAPRPFGSILLNLLRLLRCRRSPASPVFSCDRYSRSFPVLPLSRPPAPSPRRVSSSSPTRRTATASTSAWPRATNAGHRSRGPTASHGILPWLQPIAGSIPTKLPALSPKPAQTAPMAIAVNMSQSPASAEFPRSWRTLGPLFGP